MTNEELITKLAPIITKFAKERGYKVCSPMIAQAIVESQKNGGKTSSQLAEKYFNFFGMKCGSKWKGKSVNLKTNEEYTPGQLTAIRDNFRVYDSIEDGIRGYFEFLEYTRYKNLKTAKDAQTYAERIKADGWATSSTYVNAIMNYVNKYNLTRYDDFNAVVEPIIPVQENNLMIVAYDVIKGKYGNGAMRKQKLKQAGYNYYEIQKLVNNILLGK